MPYYLAQGETGLAYNPKFRECGLLVLDGGGSHILIQHCPWCGQCLPESLRDEWFARLDALGLEPGDPNIPPELLTDEWWRIRD